MQWWTFIVDVVLLVLVIRICAKSYKFSSINILHHYLIPIYSIIVFLITMKYNAEDWRMLAVLFPVAVGIGWFQTTGMVIEGKYNAQENAVSYVFKRNTQYIIGWIVTIVLGITLTAVMKGQAISQLFDKKIVNDVIQDLDPFYVFTTSHPWYIWLISGVSSFSFTVFAKRKISAFEKSHPYTMYVPKEAKHPELVRVDERKRTFIEKAVSRFQRIPAPEASLKKDNPNEKS